MARWDPFLILCVDHDPNLGWWRVWRADRVRRIRLVLDEDKRAIEARRVWAAYRALRTRRRRRQILADLVVQPGWLWRPVAHPDLAALAETALPPLEPFASAGGLIEACDRRALAREAAALRLERAQRAAEQGCARGRVGWRQVGARLGR